MFRPDMPIDSLSVLAAHIAVRALETREIDALESVMPAHTTRSVKGPRTPRAWEATTVQGVL